ncbi:MAG: imidazole glycerol phosphate synthase subunit HisH [Chloroflexi bacterium]|nr:imidazole glycerol phosphate synthase subunit HisH [Chloroflexota bacterium]MBP8059242.1 imidazole glycerol phosphate synthase subunit HisH [Chloroflexota bacterium]
MTITMIDYGGSNLRSVQKALEFVGAQVTVTDDPAGVARAEKLVLPGVGAFGAGMKALRERGLAEAVCAAAHHAIPLLGICLGMQFLFETSEEMGAHEGLGLVRGRVIRFSPNGLVVPHMGWNQIEPTREHPLLAGVAPGSYSYFVHSYYCEPTDAAATLATTDYGQPFTAIVAQDNIYGIQFHPEKSQQVGLQILRNFVGL